MAQNVTIQGASYSDVPAVELPKTGGGTATFTDTSDTTADAVDVASGEVFYNSSGTRSVGTAKYASAPVNNGNADKTNAILYGEVDSTSTSTAFTATISGLKELTDGTCVMLKNGVVTSASGFTININNLGAKPVYSNMATGNPITPTNPTRETTIFNINYTILLVYSTDLVDGGCWINYRGYNSDTNTIAYQLRTNSTVMKTSDQSRYYRMFFTSADGTHFVPANTQKDNSATSAKTVNQRPIDPFGRIIYYSYTTNLSAESDLGATYCWNQYVFALGYSFNRTGSALTLTTKTPVYLKCAPQSDGSAIMDSTEPIVQALPSTEDGKIYIFLGVAYSATNIELYQNHPVYYYKDSAIRLWTNLQTIPTKTSDLNNDSGFMTGLTQLIYGTSTWNDFITAYNAKKVVYCLVSGRMAFMAYVNNSGTNPTEVEFQYVRSRNGHTDSYQGDQVFVYKLTSAGTWTTTTRNSYTMIDTEKGLTDTYSTGTVDSVAGQGILKIKPKLRSETALTNDSVSATEVANRVYPVALDKSGYLAVNVPWTNTVDSSELTISSDLADFVDVHFPEDIKEGYELNEGSPLDNYLIALYELLGNN